MTCTPCSIPSALATCLRDINERAQVCGKAPDIADQFSNASTGLLIGIKHEPQVQLHYRKQLCFMICMKVSINIWWYLFPDVAEESTSAGTTSAPCWVDASHPLHPRPSPIPHLRPSLSPSEIWKAQLQSTLLAQQTSCSLILVMARISGRVMW